MASKFDDKGAETFVSNLFQELGGKRSRARMKIAELYPDDPETREKLFAAYTRLGAQDAIKKRTKMPGSVAQNPKRAV